MSRIKDETGRRFARLVVMSAAGVDSNKNALWRCRCDCGMQTVVPGQRLRRGMTTSCGCKQREGARARKFKDEIGRRFGRLLVTAQVHSNRHPYALWQCRCDCGNEKIVSGLNLRSGQVASCGCKSREITSRRVLKDETGRRFGR